jgi:FMN-dependent NADH-azoreductase
LLRDRPVRVVLACGGRLGSESGGQVDFATPYLRYVFAVIGLRDFKAIALENCNRRTSARAPPAITSTWLDIGCRTDHRASIG